MATRTKERFPGFKKELMRLEDEDQAEVRIHYQVLKDAQTEEKRKQLNDLLASHCHTRACRMLEILDEIKEPTIGNVGLEGSKAVSLLTLHSYLEVMKKVLAIYETVYKRNPSDIYGQAIPPLVDRIMILEHHMQLFGTNWYMGNAGKLLLVPVKDFPNMNRRRAQYGLEHARKPTILSVGATKHPLGTGKATESDQKEMAADEYEEYSRYYLKSRVSSSPFLQHPV